MPFNLEALIPIVAILATFGAPVGWYFTKQHFALRKQELELEREARQQWSQKDRAALEARLQGLETAVSAIAGSLQRIPGVGAPSLYEAPAQGAATDPTKSPLGRREGV